MVRAEDLTQDLAPLEAGITHIVVLGDALNNLLALHEHQPDHLKEVFAPQLKHPWKLSVVSAADLAGQGDYISLPADTSHILVCLEGIQAIEASGLLSTKPDTYEDALMALCHAADNFEREVELLIYAAQTSRLPTVVCTMLPPHYDVERRQSAVSTALSVFDQRIMRCAFAARLPLVLLPLVCTERNDYLDSQGLSNSGLRKLGNVILAALYAAARPEQHSEVFY